MTDPLATERRYARSMLPRVSRTFALNIAVLGGALREDVRLAYLLCRAADTIEDTWPAGRVPGGFARLLAGLDGDLAAAAALAAEALALVDDRPPSPTSAHTRGTSIPARASAGPDERDLLAHVTVLLRLLAARPAPVVAAMRECVRTMATGMGGYVTRAAARPPGTPYLDTGAELDDYCWAVAGCVGVMLTRLHDHHAGRDAGYEARLALAPRVGRALQLTNILLDWPVDTRQGRCYLPAEWLAGSGLTVADVVRPSPATRALAARFEALALAALAEVPDYVDLLPGGHLRYRLFCVWPALWAVGSLEAARRDPAFPFGTRRPKLTRWEVLRSAFGATVTRGDAGVLRRACAEAAGGAAGQTP